MKFDLSGIPKTAIRAGLQVGDVLPARGGRGETAVWLVAAIRERTAHVLGLNEAGEIVSTATYGLHALEVRDVIARCKALPDFMASMEVDPRFVQ